MDAPRSRRGSGDATPKVPAYEGGRLPLSTHLAERVRGLLAEPEQLARSCPGAVREWLADPAPALAAAGSRRAAGRELSRAASIIIWSPIASRAATRIRRSACC